MRNLLTTAVITLAFTLCSSEVQANGHGAGGFRPGFAEHPVGFGGGGFRSGFGFGYGYGAGFNRFGFNNYGFGNRFGFGYPVNFVRPVFGLGLGYSSCSPVYQPQLGLSYGGGYCGQLQAPAGCGCQQAQPVYQPTYSQPAYQAPLQAPLPAAPQPCLEGQVSQGTYGVCPQGLATGYTAYRGNLGGYGSLPVYGRGGNFFAFHAHNRTFVPLRAGTFQTRTVTKSVTRITTRGR